MDLLEGFKLFKLVRLFPAEDSGLSWSFNDRASHTDNLNNNYKLPASPNHSSCETTVEQKINVPDI